MDLRQAGATRARRRRPPGQGVHHRRRLPLPRARLPAEARRRRPRARSADPRSPAAAPGSPRSGRGRSHRLVPDTGFKHGCLDVPNRGYAGCAHPSKRSRCASSATAGDRAVVTVESTSTGQRCSCRPRGLRARARTCTPTPPRSLGGVLADSQASHARLRQSSCPAASCRRHLVAPRADRHKHQVRGGTGDVAHRSQSIMRVATLAIERNLPRTGCGLYVMRCDTL